MKGMVKPKTYGRMGNFLFQAATAIAYALKWDMPYTVPNTTNSKRDNPIYLQHLVRPEFDERMPTQRIKEQSHAYNKIPFKEEWRKMNILLDGYWQSEKYFLKYREEVIKAFRFEWKMLPHFVSFHVRRGDYLLLTKKHPPVTIQWMEKAMSLFPGRRFLFFSDDIGWCKDTFGRRDDCLFSDGVSEVDDLVKMSCCQDHICSASTFSWWGAWLNRNPEKRILMPDWWFQPEHKKFTDTSDIVPAHWERLGN